MTHIIIHFEKRTFVRDIKWFNTKQDEHTYDEVHSQCSRGSNIRQWCYMTRCERRTHSWHTSYLSLEETIILLAELCDSLRKHKHASMSILRINFLRSEYSNERSQDSLQMASTLTTKLISKSWRSEYVVITLHESLRKVTLMHVCQISYLNFEKRIFDYEITRVDMTCEHNHDELQN